jgi:hypothetical protein
MRTRNRPAGDRVCRSAGNTQRQKHCHPGDDEAIAPILVTPNNDQRILGLAADRDQNVMCVSYGSSKAGVSLRWGTVMANSTTWAQLSSYDDWDYRQALVLHEAFDDSRVSLAWKPFWSACGRRVGDRFAKRPELKDSGDCEYDQRQLPARLQIHVSVTVNASRQIWQGSR